MYDSTSTLRLSSKAKFLSSKAKCLSSKAKCLSSKAKFLSSKPKCLSSKAKCLSSKAKCLSSKTKCLSIVRLNVCVKVAEDPELYASYFWWKDFYQIRNSQEDLAQVS